MNKKLSIYPIENKDLWTLYKTADRLCRGWGAEGGDYSNDDFKSLTENQQKHLGMNLAFFANSDKIVADNLALNFLQESDENVPEEAKYFYGQQLHNEQIHAETYADIIVSYFPRQEEQLKMLTASENIPAVTKKVAWANKWLANGTFQEKLIAFAAVEGCLFASVFSTIFAYKSMQKQLPGLYWANNEISRDECYSKDTKVLTTKGFKLFSDLTLEDDVLQYTENGKLEAVKPIRLIKKPYKGKMYYMNGKNMAFCVTENHDIPFKKTSVSTTINQSQIHKTPVKDMLFGSKIYVPQKAEAIDNPKDLLTPLQRLLIALQADGSTLNFKTIDGTVKSRGVNGGYNCGISISKQRKIERLDQILSDGNFPHSKSSLDNKGNHNYRLFLDSNINIKSLKWVYDIPSISKTWALDFIEEVCKWDGCRYDKTSSIRRYDSVVKENAEIVHHIAILAGYKATLSKQVDNRKESCKDVHRVFISESQESWVNSLAIKQNLITLDYDDDVYCCAVPSGMIVTNLHGKTYIGANCTHYEFAQYLYNTRHAGTVNDATILDIILSASETEQQFVKDCFQYNPEGLNVNDMINYVQYVTDSILIGFKLQPHYNAQPNIINDYMTGIAAPKRTNFFEGKTAEYSKLTNTKFEFDEDF